MKKVMCLSSTARWRGVDNEDDTLSLLGDLSLTDTLPSSISLNFALRNSSQLMTWAWLFKLQQHHVMWGYVEFSCVLLPSRMREGFVAFLKQVVCKNSKMDLYSTENNWINFNSISWQDPKYLIKYFYYRYVTSEFPPACIHTTEIWTYNIF